jgi:MFS family permease
MNNGGNNSRISLGIIYFNVFLYAVCFQLQKPIEPFMIDKLGLSKDSDGEYARLQSFFSIMQMGGSLIFGLLLDKLGTKLGFVISFGASALSYGLLANSTTITILYLSKIPTIFQAGFLCSQAAVTDIISNSSERTAAFGRLTVAYTIGSVIGPLLGKHVYIVLYEYEIYIFSFLYNSISRWVDWL